ncbi:uncharacterized protein PgNI_02821 [Pyricularia grisea]|uniref:Uncharacterized protein n=1 Tax=Pyricularia grisea TaxID=148305 RepID=A0A6P8BBC8_PYRGI|nr:uncharacterized protein PgNI_02821 [Pyricularia grisea]TLD13109.1 hypothetical protein PgNI_02821 [Pyricularia grisea]
MRFFNLVTALALAASGAQALAVARDNIDNQAVEVNSRRDVKQKRAEASPDRFRNERTSPLASPGRGSDSITSPSGSFGRGSDSITSSSGSPGQGSDGKTGRRGKARQKINEQLEQARAKWPQIAEKCKCAADSARQKLQNCKCAAQKQWDQRFGKKDTAATGPADQPNLESVGDAGAAPAPKQKFSDQCRTFYNKAGKQVQDGLCKIKDKAQERFSGGRKTTAQDLENQEALHQNRPRETTAETDYFLGKENGGIHNHRPHGTRPSLPRSSSRPRQKSRRSPQVEASVKITKRADSVGNGQGSSNVGASEADAKPLRRIPNANNLADYFAEACKITTKDGACAVRGKDKNQGRQQRPQENPGSPRQQSKRLKVDDSAILKVRADPSDGSPRFVANPPQFPDPADRPGYKNPWDAHVAMFREMKTVAKNLVGYGAVKSPHKAQPK